MSKINDSGITIMHEKGDSFEKSTVSYRSAIWLIIRHSLRRK